MTLRGALLGGIAVMALPAMALAQTAQTSVSEVVVTAQKRSEDLQKVPVSVSVVSGAKLEDFAATNLQDWSGYVPGLQLGANGSPGLVNLSIDGIGPVAAASEVGVYVNDTPLGSSSSFVGSRAFTPDLMPYDLDQIEVLRGPQGTLYGASTMGGLIKYVLKDPDLEHFSGRIGGDIFGVENGSGVGGGARAAINAPLIKDQLAVRLSVYDENTPGYIDNATMGQKGDNAVTQYGGRAALLWKPTADFSAELSAIYSRNHSDNQAIVAISQATLQPIAGPLSNINTLPEPYTQALQLYDLHLDWDLKWATLTSVSSYQRFENNNTQDLTDYLGVYLPLFGLTAEPGQVDFHQHYVLSKWTQELRLASPTGQRFEWMLGGFYTHESGVNDEIYDGNDGSGAPLTALNPLEFADLPSTYQEYAFFGDLTWHVTGWFDIGGGLRWAHNSQNFTEIVGGTLVGSSPPTTPAETVPGSSSESVLTYQVSPTIHLNSNSILYGRIASGYQPGGPNLVLPGESLPSQFFSSRLTDYQVGVKSVFLGGRASVDLSAFDIEWSKIQVSVLYPDGFSAVGNAGTARSQGFDLGGTLSPIAALTLGANLSYDDARLTQAVPSITAASGARLPLTPMWSGSLTANWTFPITEGWRGVLGGGWRYSGSRYSFVQGSTSGGAPQGLEAKAYGVVDLHLGARSEGWTVSIFAKNLLDERAYLAPASYFNDALGFPIDITAPVLQPRTVGLSLDKAF
ncbi:MAG: TonB-dependent receptor [Caulobacteraceae bacterium]|jgi:outer membrane receptor protein involved in Fe transport